MSQAAYAILVVALALSCYFAACAAGLRTFSRARLEDVLEQSGRSSRFEPFLARTSRLLLLTGSIRTGLNLVVLLVVLWLLEDAFERRLMAFVTAFAVSVALVSVFSVAIPSSIVRYHAEPLLARSMPLLNACLLAFGPLTRLLALLDPLVRRVVGGESNHSSADDRLAEEILSVVQDHEEQAPVAEEQKDMLEAVIELRSTAAGQIMTPRTEMKGIEAGATIADVKRTILDLGHSRIPVYRDSLDQIEGILYAKDMIRYLGNGAPWDIKAVLREAYLVPESKPVSELLAEFKARKVHMAIVLDEYGGTAGLVTIEDILEEIVGEIQDEYEAPEESPAIRKLDERTVEVEARVRVTELNDELDLELPEDEDYDTVGGFVIAELGHIPAHGETLDFANVRVTVIEAERTRVCRVRVELLAAEAAPGSADGA